MKLTKLFLTIFLITLILLALIATNIFLFGDFSEIQIKILITLLSFGGFSLASLAGSGIFKKYNILSLVTINLSCIMAIWSVLMIWDIVDINNYDFLIKSFLSLIFINILLGYSSLFLRITPKHPVVQVTMFTSLTLASILTLILCNIAFRQFSGVNNFVYRLLGVLAIFSSLGTIATPILNLIYKKEDKKQDS
jgi:uncharacterized YccA/Bax inhibitor family protein